MPFPHLLLIEDDADIVDFLQADLEDAGYRVAAAFSVARGLLLAQQTHPDLILTDLGLPDGDGRQVVQTLRRRSQLPIIVLTARDDVAEKVALLAAGADDDVVKPFMLAELLDRVAVQLRAPLNQTARVGALELQPHKHLALLAGQELRLLRKECELLRLLMGQPGRVYNRQETSEALWDGELPNHSNVLDVHLANLRAKVREREVHNLLRTVRGVGFALRA